MQGTVATVHSIYEKRKKFKPANLQGRNHLEDLDVDGRIFKWFLKEVGYENVDWI
jgi:hypothetical protein